MSKESTELFPYQIEGADWLASRYHALLADDMGLGKSAQVATAADIIGANRILIICPAAARVNWQREFDKFSIFSPVFDIVTSKKFEPSHTRSIICSYDLAPTLITKENIGTFDLLVLDESHFLKSLEAKRTAAILGTEGLIRRAKRTWCLSGTPSPNHAGELWTLFYTFGVTQLTHASFIKKYCNGYFGPHGFQITGTKKAMMPELKQLLSKIMLRRTKEEVMKELPEIFYQHVVVDAGFVDIEVESSFSHYVFPIDRRKELEQILEDESKLLMNILEKTKLGATGIKMLEALAESVSTLRRYTGLQKVQSVADIITRELADFAYDKIVIFAIHRDVIEGLRLKLKQYGAVTCYGGTNPDTKQKNIDSFQNNPKTRVFIGNIQSAGTAITLTAAHNVAFIEQDWVPGNNAQAAMRCHRIGQTKPVTVRFFSLSNSLDERISKVLRRKTEELTEIFDVKK